MKKDLISILSSIAFFCFMIFYVDGVIVDWIITLFPPSVNEWLAVIRLILWIFVLSCSIGFSIWLAILFGVLIKFILGIKLKKKS